ncbi:MAG: metalloregulator ArsR/SmtB family transcription factor [Pseudomonadota bacterium]
MPSLDAVFSALADPVRRDIVARLSRGDAPVADLAAPFDISPPAISRHLKVLERAGLVRRETRAQQRIISLRPETLKHASDWVDQYRVFWDGSLDRLATFLDGDEADRHPTTSDDHHSKED